MARSVLVATGMAKSFSERVGEQLLGLRETRGVTQQDLDVMLGGKGNNRSVSRFEHGLHAMRLDTLERIALALGHRPVLVFEPMEPKRPR